VVGAGAGAVVEAAGAAFLAVAAHPVAEARAAVGDLTGRILS